MFVEYRYDGAIFEWLFEVVHVMLLIIFTTIFISHIILVLVWKMVTQINKAISQ